MTALSITSVRGQLVLLAGHGDMTGDGMVRLHDLATGARLATPLSGLVNGVSAVAVAVLDDRPVAVVGDPGGIVRAWDLTGRRPVAEFDTGRRDGLYAVAASVVDRQLTAIIGGDDTAVTVWDHPQSESAARYQPDT